MTQAYVPFEDGIILESQGYYQVKDKQKCEYCGNPAQHANCHAHRKWCPYYCGNNHNDMSIGSDWILLIFIPIYLIIKKLWRK